MRSRISACAALLGLSLFAAGCGQKGPLYLPGDPDEGRIVIPGAEPEDGQEADEDEQDEPSP
ncbi:MAG TPA: lipoprotein [Woeseiaceae bacterium]|nr:lipoprotein [Woeseiaceae bacterium]